MEIGKSKFWFNLIIQYLAGQGSNVTILGPCNIGDHAVIATGAVVSRDVMRGSVVAGVPAKVIKIISNLPT